MCEDERTVLCATGPPAAGAAGERPRLPVRLRERPSERTPEIETAWRSDVPDEDRANDRTRVLVPATGDAYAF
ncbi:hypothetical protein [Streptomyces nogalater]|uniref:Uncharacterized protein n=1 Tax=Streptomyces nogalater TaxID=38314 RepID=A0ABW0WLE0_STRNO